MALVKLSCNNTVLNGTLHLVINLNQPNGGTNSTSVQDSMGAMRFTIAVVLVYGVGVIGLLGISARRNRRLELMDKEVNKFIKSKLSKYEERRAKKPKRTIYKLISSLHSIIQSDDPEGRLNPKLKSQLSVGPGSSLCRANTWSGKAATTKLNKTHKVASDVMNHANVINNPKLSGTVHNNASCGGNPYPVDAVVNTSSSTCGTIHNTSCWADGSALLTSNPPPLLDKIYEENNPISDEDQNLEAGLKSLEGNKKVVSFKDSDTTAVSMDSIITYV